MPEKVPTPEDFLRPTTLQAENDGEGWNDKTRPTGGKPRKIITSGSRGSSDPAKPAL